MVFLRVDLIKIYGCINWWLIICLHPWFIFQCMAPTSPSFNEANSQEQVFNLQIRWKDSNCNDLWSIRIRRKLMKKGKLRTHVRAIACISDLGVSGVKSRTWLHHRHTIIDHMGTYTKQFQFMYVWSALRLVFVIMCRATYQLRHAAPHCLKLHRYLQRCQWDSWGSSSGRKSLSF